MTSSYSAIVAGGVPEGNRKLVRKWNVGIAVVSGVVNGSSTRLLWAARRPLLDNVVSNVERVGVGRDAEGRWVGRIAIVDDSESNGVKVVWLKMADRI